MFTCIFVFQICNLIKQNELFLAKFLFLDIANYSCGFLVILGGWYFLRKMGVPKYDHDPRINFKSKCPPPPRNRIFQQLSFKEILVPDGKFQNFEGENCVCFVHKTHFRLREIWLAAWEKAFYQILTTHVISNLSTFVKDLFS